VHVRAAPFLLASCATAPGPTVGSDPARPTEGGSCEDFALDVERVWSRERSASVRVGLLQAGGKSTEETVERIVTRMDAVTRDWVMLREKACRDTMERDLMPREVYVKVSSCLDVALIQQRTAVTLLDNPTSTYLSRANDALERIMVDTASCQHEAVYNYYDAKPSPADQTLATAGVHASFASTEAGVQAQQAAVAVGKDPTLRRRFESHLVNAQWALGEQVDIPRALAFAKQALDVALAEGYDVGQADVELFIGRAEWLRGNHTLALEHLQRATTIRARVLGAKAAGTIEARRATAMTLVDHGRADLVERAVSFVVGNNEELTRIWLWTLAAAAYDMGYYGEVQKLTKTLSSRELSVPRRVVVAMLEIRSQWAIGARDTVEDVRLLAELATGYSGSRAQELGDEVRLFAASACADSREEYSKTKHEPTRLLADRYCRVYEDAYGPMPAELRRPILSPCWADDGACSTRAWLDYP